MKWNRRTLLTTVVGSGFTTGGAGCLELRGGDRDGSGQNDRNDDHDDESGPVSRADIAMLTDEEGHRFEPPLVWVETGGTVAWTNESGSHTTTAYHPDFDQPLRIPDDAEPWDSGMFTEEDASFEWTFETDGVYDYFCIPHHYRAMVGTVIVGDPDPHGQPGLEEPQAQLPEEARELLAMLHEQTNEKLGYTRE